MDRSKVVVWRSSDGTHVRARARTIVVDGTLGSTKTVSAAGFDVGNPQVAADSTGRAANAWGG